MKQNFTIILFLLISISAFSQISFDLTGTVISKDIPATNVKGAVIQTGTSLRILEYGVYTSPDGAAIPGHLVKVDDKSFAFKANRLNRIQLDKATTVYEQWDQILLFSELPEAYADYGYQYDIRNELEEEAREIINIYIIKGLATRQMSNNAAANLEALRHLQTAESLDLLPNINVFKQQGIT